MLEVRLRPTDVARAPQPARSYALRERPLDACAPPILCLILSRLLTLTRRLQRTVLLLPSDSDRAPLGARAPGATRTWLTVSHRELDLHELVAALIYGRGPTQASAPLRAGSLLLLPVEPEAPGGLAQIFRQDE